jgi:hypothetical protein
MSKQIHLGNIKSLDQLSDTARMGLHRVRELRRPIAEAGTEKIH